MLLVASNGWNRAGSCSGLTGPAATSPAGYHSVIVVLACAPTNDVLPAKTTARAATSTARPLIETSLLGVQVVAACQPASSLSSTGETVPPLAPAWGSGPVDDLDPIGIPAHGISMPRGERARFPIDRVDRHAVRQLPDREEVAAAGVDVEPARLLLGRNTPGRREAPAARVDLETGERAGYALGGIEKPSV